MAELPIATQCGTGAPAAPHLDSGLRRNDEVGGGNDGAEWGKLWRKSFLAPMTLTRLVFAKSEQLRAGNFLDKADSVRRT